MKIQNKTEIYLSEEEVKNIIYKYLRKEYEDGEYSFRFKLKRGMFDDRHVFDSVQVTITNV